MSALIEMMLSMSMMCFTALLAEHIDLCLSVAESLCLLAGITDSVRDLVVRLPLQEQETQG